MNLRWTNVGTHTLPIWNFQAASTLSRWIMNLLFLSRFTICVLCSKHWAWNGTCNDEPALRKLSPNTEGAIYSIKAQLTGAFVCLDIFHVLPIQKNFVALGKFWIIFLELDRKTEKTKFLVILLRLIWNGTYFLPFLNAQTVVLSTY